MIQWIRRAFIYSRYVSPEKILKYPEGKRIYSDFHSIRKNYIDTDALKVVGRLHKFGYKAYIVGGCVRDLLLNRIPKDYDIVTNALPNEVRKIFGNSRVIGKRFRLVHIRFRGNKVIEVSTARSLPKSRVEFAKNSDELYLEQDNQYGSFKEDAARRDFTVNALFFDVRNEALIDYSGGFEDLSGKVLRVIGNENISFPEDPVRMLRAIKFKSLLGFELQPELIKALKKHRHSIRKASKARLHEEFNKIFRTGQSYQVFEDMARYELFEAMFPSIAQVQKEKHANWPQNFENTWLGTSLKIADRMISEHEDMNITLYYSILCADLVSHFFSLDLPEKNLSEKIAIRLKKPAEELGIARKEHDRIIEIFANQPLFAKEVQDRNKTWVKNFKSKDCFLETFIFYKINARAQQNDEAIQKALFWEIGLRKKLPQSIHKTSTRALLSQEELQKELQRKESSNELHHASKGNFTEKNKNQRKPRHPRNRKSSSTKTPKSSSANPKNGATEKKQANKSNQSHTNKQSSQTKNINKKNNKNSTKPPQPRVAAKPRRPQNPSAE